MLKITYCFAVFMKGWVVLFYLLHDISEKVLEILKDFCMNTDPGCLLLTHNKVALQISRVT